MIRYFVFLFLILNAAFFLATFLRKLFLFLFLKEKTIYDKKSLLKNEVFFIIIVIIISIIGKRTDYFTDGQGTDRFYFMFTIYGCTGIIISTILNIIESIIKKRFNRIK